MMYLKIFCWRFFIKNYLFRTTSKRKHHNKFSCSIRIQEQDKKRLNIQSHFFI
ncbi:unnamed protein product [Paramecium pentaurelia]|uniref:Uncharacterized protein n=1 Tax=Paramecium pentaurelia TaxID=43138 RepID=A0A8S1W4X4_9CILI|nr:unnamed protein product [Paramecium pentaurelia]